MFDFYGFSILIFHGFCFLDIILTMYYYVNPSQVMDSTRIEIWTEEGFDSGVIGAIHLEVAKHLDSSFDLIFLDGEEAVFGIIQITK